MMESKQHTPNRLKMMKNVYGTRKFAKGMGLFMIFNASVLYFAYRVENYLLEFGEVQKKQNKEWYTIKVSQLEMIWKVAFEVWCFVLTPTLILEIVFVFSEYHALTY